MRAFRLFPVVALVVVGSLVSSAGASPSAPRCKIPHSWRVVAQDRQAIVIAQRDSTQPRYAYCNRSVGRLRQLGTIAPFRLLIAGRYVAYVSLRPPPGPVTISLTDTSSGHHNQMSLLGTSSLSPVPTFLLSPKGVAAAIVLRQPAGAGAPPGAGIQVLTMRNQYENLDGASPPSEIANLQLYDCAAGCAPNTVIVAWTHSGTQMYAQISR
jgi:hypothetical protein